MQKATHIFFIGIGGKGLNGIAKMCLEKGMRVSGVDIIVKSETEYLSDNGARIFYEHRQSNVSEDVDLVVYSSLIDANCPEIISARQKNIRTIKRAEFLGLLTRNNFRISISGSHGKSTTTALVGLSMINANVDPSIYGGAYTKELQSYNHRGKSKYAVIEACEYDRSFLHLIGDISILTSIEKGHLEYYTNEADMIDSFRMYIKRHKPSATIIANGDDYRVRSVTHGSNATVLYFGFDPRNEYSISDVIQHEHGSTFSLCFRSKKILHNMSIKIPGTYNIYNFVAAAIVLHVLGLPLSGVLETARHFTGVGRRFEITTVTGGPIFIDDFAHHPTQVRQLFDGIQQFFPHYKTCAIFQPRQFNLMKNFSDEYGAAFQKANEVIMTDIIPGLGDTPYDIQSISTHSLAKKICERSGVSVKIMNDFSSIVEYVCPKYGPDGVVATIGAGDIYKIRDLFIKGNISV